MNIADRHRPMQPMQAAGIPGWLQQFLNSQGGMQGLLYSAGGIQGLLQMIQSQSQQPRSPSPNNPTSLPSYLRDHPADPLGWQDWLTENHPLPEYDPTGKTETISDRRGGYFTLPQQSNVENWGRTLSLDEIEQFKAAQGLRGDEMLAAIPERFRNTPEAIQMARLGRNPAITNDSFSLDPRIMFPGVSGPGKLKPVPMHKYDYASQYGYGSKAVGAPEYQGQQFSTDRGLQYMHGGRGPNFRQFGPDSRNILQTLRNAGWDPDTQGWGPQEWEGKTPEQQTMLNDLVYAISPKNAPLGTSHERYLAKQKEAPLPEAPDPFAGMQSAINRDAYVNETLGGGFYGGLIPEQDAINTFGNRRIGGAQDPHFPTPQLALNPLPGQSRYDTYAGWAADQGSAFGQAPWASDSAWGHAQGFDRPNLYQQPPPPTTAWQPTPQFGSWGGTQGWGNTSRNGSQNQNAWGSNNNQQQPMSFGASPWGAPWGMS